MFNRIPLVELPTPIQYLTGVSQDYENNFFIKRDDLAGPVPGGNKARKLEFIMGEVKKKGCDHVITCGSVFSNHCRLTAMTANKLGIDCSLILNGGEMVKGEVKPKLQGNYFIFQLMDVDIELIDRSERENTMKNKYKALKQKGKKPYLIEAGGNEPAGVHGYVETAAEIKEQTQLPGEKFDFMFIASGTGTTQAGLLIGKHINRCVETMVGISVEAEEKEGKQKIIDSIEEYSRSNEIELSLIGEDIHFVDNYMGKGYGKLDENVASIIKYMVSRENILLDPIYTGKAFSGMLEFLREHKIKNRNILFLHTGGLPIAFNKSEDIMKLLGGQ